MTQRDEPRAGEFPASSTIKRRDFLGGVALVVASGLSPRAQLAAAEAGQVYPPALTGLRGSHAGAFEAAHALRDGTDFGFRDLAVEERVDLVVVGGGISGLASAWFWRQRQGDAARILILDNHDDFGGHARRNEFTAPGGRLMIGYGGSESLEAPKANFSPVVNRLMEALGIDLKRFETAYDQSLYEDLGLTAGSFFNREDFGVDALVAGDPTSRGADPTPGRAGGNLEAFIAAFPLSDRAKAELLALYRGETPPFPPSAPDGRPYLEATSYRDHLKNACGLGDEALRYFDGLTLDYYAIGPDALPAGWAAESGFPGFGPADDTEDESEEPYIYHFPDGNAGVARLLVRALIPAAVPGASMEDVVLARTDYARLDRPEDPIRLRLGSTVVHAANREDGVELVYVKDGKPIKIRAGAAVLAGYNMMIPYIVPDLPEAQKAALARNVKAPLVYVNVLVRNWQSIADAGVSEVYCPRAFCSIVKLDFPVALGGYSNPKTPSEPMVLHMVHVPNAPGLPQNDQFRAGRASLLDMTFEDYERKISDQLDRMFGPTGFDAGTDILAITVNRWPHGYAGSLNPLFDSEDGDDLMDLARQPFGRIAIAGADAGWNAFAHEAIDQAHRAVEELTA